MPCFCKTHRPMFGGSLAHPRRLCAAVPSPVECYILFSSREFYSVIDGWLGVFIL